MDGTNKDAARQRDLLELSHELSRSLPPLGGEADSYVIVVEERQAFLAEALPYVAVMTDGNVPIAAVGVAPDSAAAANLNPELQFGIGSDELKMAVVAAWVRGGLLGRKVTLLTPPHRAVLLNGILRRQLWLEQIGCATEAMDTPQDRGVSLLDVTVQAQRVLRAMSEGLMDPLADFMPGGRLRQAYERLVG